MGHSCAAGPGLRWIPCSRPAATGEDRLLIGLSKLSYQFVTEQAYRGGIGKAEIAHRLQIARTSVRGIWVTYFKKKFGCQGACAVLPKGHEQSPNAQRASKNNPRIAARICYSLGFNGKAWLDQLGKPSTEALHVIERFHRKDFGQYES
jgi:hypothetical protein